jgi:type IX secretion system PorP/SprF family membrane protein
LTGSMTTATKYFLVMLLILVAGCCRAQLNPYQSMYFQNRYLNNPAMAGLDEGFTLNFGYMQQWNAFPGEPQSEYISGEYRATDNVGLGANIMEDQSGVFLETRIMGTYAYHVPLDDQNQKLNFGLSLGVNDSRINFNVVNADLSDEVLTQYDNNHINSQVDGDLGVAYTSDNLFVEAVMPNLSATIFNRQDTGDDVDRTIFFAAISYKFNLDGNDDSPFSVEPLAAYRKIKGFTNIYDAGFNLKMNDYHLDLQGIYHTNDTYGLGIVLDEKTYAINLVYNIYTGPIANYANGAFEIGLKLKLN